jgi:hypothetical protein
MSVRQKKNKSENRTRIEKLFYRSQAVANRQY